MCYEGILKEDNFEAGPLVAHPGTQQEKHLVCQPTESFAVSETVMGAYRGTCQGLAQTCGARPIELLVLGVQTTLIQQWRF